MADSRIKSAAELISSFFDQDVVKKGQEYSGFGKAWKNLAGARLGEHSHPVDIRHGILIVEAEHQGWMQLIQLQQDHILEEIGRKFPDLGIRGLAFRLGSAPEGGNASGGEAAAPAEARAVSSTEAVHSSDEAAAAQAAAARDASDFAAHAATLPPELAARFSALRKNLKK